MIYCIWYPSGGFGHFINSILSTHGQNFVRPSDVEVEFSNNGNAHKTELVAPKYKDSLKYYNFSPDDPDKNYSVLIDNGINNESEEFKKIFPGAKILKICYSDRTWPIIARTMINKAMNSSLLEQLPVEQTSWIQPACWAQREKYFLFLRDHYLRNQWKASSVDRNIYVDDLLDYNSLFCALNKAGIQTDNFQDLWQRWYLANDLYIRPVVSAWSIIEDIKNNTFRCLQNINDIWEQAIIYYFLWLEFGQEVPHNDYSNFFNNTIAIKSWLQL